MTKFKMTLRILLIIFILQTLQIQAKQPQEPNKKSIELFKLAIDTLQSADKNNLQKRKTIALNLFSKAIEADKKNIPAYLWKIIILTNLKKYDDALKIINDAIESSKNNADFMLPQLFMSKGSLYLLQNDNQKAKWAYYDAIKAFKEVLKENKCNSEAVTYIPMIYAIVGEKDKAFQYIENNKKCYQHINIEQLKKIIKDFKIETFIEQLKKQG